MLSRLGISTALAAMALCAACGSSTTSEAPATPAADAATDHSEHAALSKVFFVEPKDGATIKSEAHIVFGSEQFTIAAVPSGEVKDARPGTGHYHLAVDTDCLPVGEAIPKADPWTHFGKGTDSADLQLKPGKHTLTVQAGDDMHKTMTGLCQTITVTVQ